ncbi:unnamed protein product [Caenorhabditis bovis]|uniref:Uncharacterized protein n=1 Tax=Caenorhabditis bovis TaxID=2654633 RepID=A0A8S1F9W2_9PELO|nr:unnamed protein product [Caenorhabditis bovis]
METTKRFQSKVFSSIVSLNKNASIEEDEIKDKRFRIHVRFISVFIAIAELSILMYQVANGSWFNSDNSLIMIFAAVLLLVVIVLLFLAIFYRIGALLVPHIVMQTLLVLSLLGMAAFSLYALFSGASLHVQLVITNPDAAAESMVKLPSPLISTNVISSFLCGTLLLFFIMYLVMVLINVWCLRVVVDCYKFLTEHRIKRRSSTSEEDSYCAPKTIQLSLYPNQVVQATDF